MRKVSWVNRVCGEASDATMKSNVTSLAFAKRTLFAKTSSCFMRAQIVVPPSNPWDAVTVDDGQLVETVSNWVFEKAFHVSLLVMILQGHFRTC